MQISYKIVKKANSYQWDQLKSFHNQLINHWMKVGYFSAQGSHESNRNTKDWSYAHLMAFHELYANTNGIPLRPVFGQAIKYDFKNIMRKIRGSYRERLKAAMLKRHLTTHDNIGILMELCAIHFAFYIDKRFGMRTLAKNSPVTIAKKKGSNPMIETGQLRDNLAFRTSMQLKHKLWRNSQYV